MATVTKRAMATAMAVVSGKEGKGNNNKIVGIDNEGGWRAKQQGQWQQGWRANNGNKGSGDGNGNNVGNCNGDEADGQRKGNSKGGKGKFDGKEGGGH